MWDQYDQFGWWWYVMMPVAMLAFWALVAWLVVTIVRSGRVSDPDASRAEAILAERYARGEIDAEEYHRRLRDLEPAGPGNGGSSSRPKR
jgi:putative membrane protein